MSRVPGQFDIDDIAKLILGVIGDADSRLVALDTHPFVRFAVFEISRMIEASHNVYLPSLAPRAGVVECGFIQHVPAPTFSVVYKMAAQQFALLSSARVW